MKISANIRSEFNYQETIVETDGVSKKMQMLVKPNGYGSAINGGELLLLALATCFCNDLYREAAKREITISSVDVECIGHFGEPGEAGSNFEYKTSIISDASDEEVAALIKHTDEVAEVHNTLRKGLSINLVS